MFGAISRLVAIAVSAVFMAIFAVVFIRWMGSHQQFEAPPHAWLTQAKWTIEAPPAAAICALPAKGSMLLIPITRGPDQWLVRCKSPTPLKDVLSQFKSRDVLLQIEAKDNPHLNDWLEELVEVGNQTHAAKLGVWAPAQRIARYLRQKAPQWMFAADSGALLRLHVFSSLWIEPAMDFWPDFVVASNTLGDGSRLSEREIFELHRRHKRIVWRGEMAPSTPLDGILTP